MKSSTEIRSYTLGQIQNNTFLLIDQESKNTIIIDPASGIEKVITVLQDENLALKTIWITHAHFDHIAGVYQLLHAFGTKTPLFLYPDDLPLWNAGGGARDFGFDFDPRTKPTDFFHHGQVLEFAGSSIEVRHTPGHTPGHVILYWEDEHTAFCGDLIFYHGVGRTDMSYSNQEDLLTSIRENVFTLPDDTVLLCGHGSSTSVGEEKQENPFLV